MFSQRIGITPTEKLVQYESMDDALRNSLWSLLSSFYWDRFDLPMRIRLERGRHDYTLRSNLSNVFTDFWINYLKEPSDTIPTYFYESGGSLLYLREYFFEAKWYQIYDFIELVSKAGPIDSKSKFIESCNNFLEKENSAYRFVNGDIAEISSKEEIESVESAIRDASPYGGSKEHLVQALSHLKNRENPDYRNSIKESISAVEALCREIEGGNQAKLGAALTALEKKGVLHPALKKAFSALYGYTSDADGIRHALLEDGKLTSEDARFMLVSCSAFINYVIGSVEKSV